MTYAAPMLLARCATCSAREDCDVFVMPGHRHAEPTPPPVANPYTEPGMWKTIRVNGVVIPVTGWSEP